MKDWQPEVFTENSTWQTLFEAADEVFTSHLTAPTIELEEIRNITKDTDPFIISQTLKQLGFDLPLDLIAGNEERLAKAIYLLPLFFETSGTDEFVRPIEFVLGRKVDVRQLFTQDYKNFHTTPLGALIQDGGEWYKTTHINLAMEALDTDNNLLLSEQETIATRLIDAFYEFAPIELVVNEFRRLLVIHAELGLMGEVNIWPQRRIIAGEGHCEPTGVRVIGPDTVNSFEDHQFKVEVYFSAVEASAYSPVFGHSNTRVNTGNEINALLLQTMPDWEDQVFTIEPRADEFAYFALPVTLGLIDFYDVSTGFRGAWDGATWPEDDIGKAEGPLVVRRTIDGVSSDWYLYRTDFSGLRKSAWSIKRKNEVVVVPSPVYVKQNPSYFVGPWGMRTEEDLDNFTSVAPSDPRSLVLPKQNVNDDQYLYFAISEDAGPVDFFVTRTNQRGNFDGATWPENDTGDSFTPILVSRTIEGTEQRWNLYRSDFEGLEEELYIEWADEIPEIPTNTDVSSENSNSESRETSAAPTSEKSVPLMPLYFEGPLQINTTEKLLAVFDQMVELSDQPVNINLTIPADIFSYVLLPATTFEHNFLDVGSNFSGAWDGADWDENDNGTNGELFPVMMPIQGVDVDWYLFRTDFSEQTDSNYRVTWQGELGSVMVPVPSAPMESRCKSRIEYAREWYSNKQGVINFGELGVASIADQTAEHDVVVQVTHLGFTNSKTVTVVPLNKGEMQDITILGPDVMNSGETILFLAEGHFSRGEPQTVYPRWVRTNPALSLSPQGEVVAGNVKEDTDVYITAKILSHSGVELIAAKKITIRSVTDKATPSKLTISGPSEVLENDTGTFVATAVLTNGESFVVNPLWTVHSNAASMDNRGKVSLSSIEDDATINLTARYTLNGVGIEEEFQFIAKKLRYSITSIEILGPSNVQEKTRAQYSCVATWDQIRPDGTNVRTYISADWETSGFLISDAGTFEIGAVDVPRSITLTATVAKPSGTGVLIARREVVVQNVKLALESVKIQGPEAVREGLVSKYSAFAKFNDGTERSVIPDWNIKNNPAYASIDSSGRVTFDNTQNSGEVGIIEIRATYQFGERVVDEGLPTVLIPHVDTLRGIEIFYVTRNDDGTYNVEVDPEVEVEEGRRIHLLARATYVTDASDPQNPVLEVRDVSPKWKLINTDPVNIQELPARILQGAGIGIVEGRNIVQDTAVWVEASYFSKSARFRVIVTDFVPDTADPVLTSWLDGPSIVFGSEIGSYAQYCVFGQGIEQIPSPAIAVSSSWSLDVDSTVALIDDHGYLTSNVTSTQRVKIKSVYTCGTEVVEREISVDLVPANHDFSELRITGPATIIENTQVQFFAELERVDGSISNVNAVWTVEPQVVGVQALPPGVLFATDMAEDTVIQLVAKYVEGDVKIETSKDVLVSKVRAAWGIGEYGIDSADALLGISTLLPNLSDDYEFAFEAGVGQYGYFITPVSSGPVTIESADGQIQDAWDGASWPENGVGERGPIVVTRTFNSQSQDWYVYRTNFSQLRSASWKVKFDNS